MTTNESEKVLAAKVDETQTTTTTATATAPTATKTCELVSVSSMLSMSGSSVVTFMYDSIVSSVGTIVAFFSSSSSSSGKDDTTKSETNVLNHVEVVLDEKVTTTTTTEHDNEKETSALPSPLETPSTMIDEEEINEIIKEIVFDVTRPDECLVEDIDAELKI